MSFVQKGTSHKPEATARSWEIKVDVGRKLQFPDMVHTALRPDIVLWSPEDKKGF